MQAPEVIVRDLGLTEYLPCWQHMVQFTNERNGDDADEIWLVEHPPVFTQGQSGKPEHLFNPGEIPVVQTDRGGQITYHGPGQIVIYPLLNLKRLRLGVRDLVTAIETSIVQCLEQLGISANAKKEAPGVYVRINETEHKIASLGLRVRKGCSFHGLALNTDMDLAPFLAINPCGYEGLPMTQVIDCSAAAELRVDEVRTKLCQSLVRNLGYNSEQIRSESVPSDLSEHTKPLS